MLKREESGREFARGALSHDNRPHAHSRPDSLHQPPLPGTSPECGRKAEGRVDGVLFHIAASRYYKGNSGILSTIFRIDINWFRVGLVRPGPVFFKFASVLYDNEFSVL